MINTVFSACDGGSMLQEAMVRAGVLSPVYRYYASEIDKYPIKVTQANWPDTQQVGDIHNVDLHTFNGDPIDFMAGGFPCPSFSVAGKGKGFDDPRGQVFWEIVRLKDVLKPKWFLFENVPMKQEYQDVINKHLGVEPIEINSSLVSAQNRRRLYWTNIPYAYPPEDKGIMLKDILEDGYVDRDKSHCLDANYWKGGNLKTYFEKHRRQLVFSKDQMCHVGDADLNGHGYLKRVYHSSGKAPTLTSNGGGNREPKVYVEPMKYRKLTPLECERLQTLPDNYTNHVSNTQRYKVCGNGFTVDVIAHILKGLKI
jgi:DNA-cytosine methyltransferase